MRRLNLARGNGDVSTYNIKWAGLGKPLTCEAEGEGAVENKPEVPSVVSLMDGKARNRGRRNSHWNRFKSTNNCFYS